MTNPAEGPQTIDKLQTAAHSAFAMLAGMQLDLFTPLADGPMTSEQIAQAIAVNSEQLERLLYALVAAELLSVDGGRFSNTPESDQFLVRGKPNYLGARHEAFLRRWNAILMTAETIRSGSPQAKIDFTAMSDGEMEAYFRGLHPEAVASAQALVEIYDLSPTQQF